MAHVSPKKVAQKAFSAMQKQLLMSVVHARTKNEGAVLLSELLTKTERVMLAKRLAAIAMVVRGYSIDQIMNTLQISADTVGRIRLGVQQKQWAHLVRYVRNNPKKFEENSFLDVLEKLLQAGMPPRGRGRWDTFKRATRTSEYFDR
jgi:uncharacterized protein YerC